MEVPKHRPTRLLPAELLWLPRWGTGRCLAQAHGEQCLNWGAAHSLARLAPPAWGFTATSFAERFPLDVATRTLGVSIAWSGGEGATLQLLGPEQDPSSSAAGSAEATQQRKMRLSLFCLPHPRLGKCRVCTLISDDT